MPKKTILKTSQMQVNAHFVLELKLHETAEMSCMKLNK